MTHRKTTIEIDHIPSYAALILIKEEDIYLIEAGKRYRDFFALDCGDENQSVLCGFSATEKTTLCTSIYSKAKQRKEFVYYRKALRRNPGTSWIHVRASYLEEMDGAPVYIAVAEDVTDVLMTKMQLEETASSLERVNRELDRQIYHQCLIDKRSMCEAIIQSSMDLSLLYLSHTMEGTIPFSREEMYDFFIENIMTDYLDVKIFKYDVGAGNAAINGKAMREFGLPETIDHMPWDLIEAGVIAAESRKSYEEMFRDIRSGSPDGKAVIHKKSSIQGWTHYQLDYATVFDKDGKPEHALIFCQDIERQYMSGMIYAMIQELMDSKPDDQYTILNCILSEDRIEDIRGGLFNLEGHAQSTGDMDQVMEFIKEKWISAEDRMSWEEFNDRSRLLCMYDSGVHNIKRTYSINRHEYGRGKQAAQENAILFTSPYSGYVHMWCVLEAVSPDAGSEQLSAAMELPEQPDALHSPKVYIRTFGYFDVFVDGKILEFTSKKGKELLALLVDRNGGLCTAEEAVSILWENEPMDKAMAGRYRQTALRLKKTLEEAGIGDIIISRRTGKTVDKSRFDCDLYQFLGGDRKYKRLFHHHYMTNYSWGENTLAILEAMKGE